MARVFLFLLHGNGLVAAEGAASIVSVLGILVTITMLPETKGRGLEELNHEHGLTADSPG